MAPQSLNGGDSLTVTSTGTLTVSGSTVAVTLKGSSTALETVINSGTITQTGTGRAIRDNTGGLNVSITNSAGALIKTADADVIQMNVTGSNVTLNNYGTMNSLNASSGGSQAVDFNALNTGTNIVNNFATGLLQATSADAVRPGTNGVVNNSGTIKSINAPGGSSDGIDMQSNNGITITNAAASTSGSGATNLIEGARHGITGGNTGTLNNVLQTTPTQLNGYIGTGAYSATITNNAGGTIQGDDGSGINIDGFGIQGAGSKLITNELITVTNHGTITGHGVSGDGDGVDVDGDVNIDNFGSITSKNSVGSASSKAFSEGITVGGGSITNEASATIEGKTDPGNLYAVGRGITLAGIDKNAAGGDIALESIYENSTITNSGLIKGDSDSGIAVLGTTGGGYNVTITNNTASTIEGYNTGVSEATNNNGQSLNQGAIELDDKGNTYTINNSGTIMQDNTSAGTAVAMHGSSNSLNILGGSASVIGNVTGDTAADSTLTINPGAGNTFTYNYGISNFTVKINTDGTKATTGTVTLNGASTNTGTTTVYGGKAFIDNTTGSGTGSGKVVVESGAILGGSGTIQTGQGNDVQVMNGGTLMSGVTEAPGTTTITKHLTLDNTMANSTILDASAGNATLAFNLGINPAVTAGTYDFANPDSNSSYLDVLGSKANELVFNGVSAKDIIQITTFGDKSKFNLNTPYLLIKAYDDAAYSGLETTGGTIGGVVQDGWVENLTLEIDGVTYNNDSGNRLYLDHGDLEVTPEPSTWALLIGGGAVLAYIQIRRRKTNSVQE